MRTEFVPVVANTQDLQYHHSPAGKWFLDLVRASLATHVSTRSGSKLSGQVPWGAHTEFDLNRQMTQTDDPQGMYILSPDGTPFGFTNDHYPDDIQRFINASLTGFRAHMPRRVVVSASDKATPWAITPAPSTQVLQVFARIPNPPKDCSELNQGSGRDFCWVYPDEAATLAARLARAKPGARVALPAALVRRIARFHLVDDVRGTPDMWQSKHVRQLTVTARALPPLDGGQTGRLTFDGPFALQNTSGHLGYTGTLDGLLHVNLATHQLTHVRALAEGHAWGAGQFTPHQPPGHYLLRVALINTRDPAARIVPPEEVATAGNDRAYRHP